MKFSGSKEYIKAMEAEGLNNPTINEEQTLSIYSFETGEMENDTLFPIQLTFLKDIPEDELAPDSSAVFGKASSRAFIQFDSVSEGWLLTSEVADFCELQTEAQSLFLFPPQKMEKGDELITKKDFRMPLMGESIVIQTSIKLKLIKILEDHAVFQITENYAVSPGNGELKLEVSGTGKGTGIYDFQNQFFRNYDTTIKMKMTFEYEADFQIHLDMKSESKLEFEVSP